MFELVSAITVIYWKTITDLLLSPDKEIGECSSQPKIPTDIADIDSSFNICNDMVCNISSQRRQSKAHLSTETETELRSTVASPPSPCPPLPPSQNITIPPRSSPLPPSVAAAAGSSSPLQLTPPVIRQSLLTLLFKNIFEIYSGLPVSFSDHKDHLALTSSFSKFSS